MSAPCFCPRSAVLLGTDKKCARLRLRIARLLYLFTQIVNGFCQRNLGEKFCTEKYELKSSGAKGKAGFSKIMWGTRGGHWFSRPRRLQKEIPENTPSQSHRVHLPELRPLEEPFRGPASVVKRTPVYGSTGAWPWP